MSRDLRVVAPIERLYVRNGVEVALLWLEVWSGGVIVRLGGLPGEQSERLEREYVQALEDWGRAGREGRAREARPREQPAEQLFDVDLALSDDVATRYELRVCQGGGSGRLLRADWTFEPGPPDSATRLTVAVAGQGIERRSVEVAL